MEKLFGSCGTHRPLVSWISGLTWRRLAAAMQPGHPWREIGHAEPRRLDRERDATLDGLVGLIRDATA